jgi:hypothetical protein
MTAPGASTSSGSAEFLQRLTEAQLKAQAPSLTGHNRRSVSSDKFGLSAKGRRHFCCLAFSIAEPEHNLGRPGATSQPRVGRIGNSSLATRSARDELIARGPLGHGQNDQIAPLNRCNSFGHRKRGLGVAVMCLERRGSP